MSTLDDISRTVGDAIDRLQRADLDGALDMSDEAELRALWTVRDLLDSLWQTPEYVVRGWGPASGRAHTVMVTARDRGTASRLAADIIRDRERSDSPVSVVRCDRVIRERAS